MEEPNPLTMSDRRRSALAVVAPLLASIPLEFKLARLRGDKTLAIAHPQWGRRSAIRKSTVRSVCDRDRSVVALTSSATASVWHRLVLGARSGSSGVVRGVPAVSVGCVVRRRLPTQLEGGRQVIQGSGATPPSQASELGASTIT